MAPLTIPVTTCSSPPARTKVKLGGLAWLSHHLHWGQGRTRRHSMLPKQVAWSSHLKQKLREDWETVIVLASVTLSFASLSVYITEKYHMESELVWRKVDLAFAVVFTVEWWFWFWMARSKRQYLCSLQCWVDVLSVLPMYVCYFHDGNTWLLTMTNLLRTLRVLRITAIFRASRNMASELMDSLFVLAVTMVALLLITAGLFYEIETSMTNMCWDQLQNKDTPVQHQWCPSEEDLKGKQSSPLQFHEAVYWSAVTLGTIGYGDYSPGYWPSQLVLIIMLVLMLTLLPYLTSQVVSALGATNKYQRDRYRGRLGKEHVVVVGSVEAVSAERIISELFHEDHGFSNMTLVLLSPQPPGASMKAVLSTSKFWQRVKYIQGHAMVPSDLDRVSLHRANAVFIVADKCTRQPQVEDNTNIMELMALAKFLQQKAALKRTKKKKANLDCNDEVYIPQIFLQLLQPESRQRLEQMLQAMAPSSFSELSAAVDGKPSPCKPSFWWELSQKLSVISVSELKLGLLSHSALMCPGLSTLVNNLVKTEGDTSMETLPSFAAGPQIPTWVQEYMRGASMEIYCVENIPFIGTFCQVAVKLYLEYGCILLATEKNGQALAVAPLEQVVDDKTRCYVIAPDIQAFGDLRKVESVVNLGTLSRIVEAVEEEQPSKDVTVVVAEGQGQDGSPTKQDLRAQGSKGGDMWKRSGPSSPRGRISKLAGIRLPPIKVHTEDSSKGYLLSHTGHPFHLIPATIGQNTDDSHASQYLRALYHVNTSGVLDSRQLPCDLKDHVLVCGQDIPGALLFNLIAPLRSQRLKDILPVVVLDSHMKCTGAAWQAIRQFQEVYFLQGSVMDREDLLRARAQYACRAILVPHTTACGDSELLLEASAVADNDIIHSFHQLRSINAQIDIYTELISPDNIAFMSLGVHDEYCRLLWDINPDLGVRTQPQFTSGCAILSGLTDTLMCQCYLSGRVDKVLYKILFDWHSYDPSASLGTGNGSLTPARSLEALDSFRKGHQPMPKVHRPLPNMKPGSTPVTMVSYNVGRHYKGQPFGNAFERMLMRDGLLCVGLFRGVPQGSRDPEFKYVVTNPPKDLVIADGDRAFVLCDISQHAELLPWTRRSEDQDTFSVSRPTESSKSVDGVKDQTLDSPRSSDSDAFFNNHRTDLHSMYVQMCPR